jgi:ABC-type amino acid transport substrate-binding protein
MKTLQTTIIVALAFACGILFTKDKPTAAPAGVSPSAVYEKVIASGTIKAGYLVYPPACIKDPNTGKLSGIFVESLEKAAGDLGMKLEWIEASGWGTMIEDIKSGKEDIIGSAVWANSSRGKHAGFSTPLYWSGVCAFVRADDTRFDTDLSKINDPSVKVATIDGEMAELIANADFPSATKVSLPQNSELSLSLENVAVGKADITFAEPFFVNLYLKNNPGKLKNVTPAKPLRVFPNCMILPKTDVALKSMLDTALFEQLNSGFMDKLIQKYAPGLNSVFPSARPYTAQ